MKTDDRASPHYEEKIMTILYNQVIHEFDPDPKLAEYDRAQPISVEPGGVFVVLTQVDSAGEYQNCILVERRDIQAFIEALQRA